MITFDFPERDGCVSLKVFCEPWLIFADKLPILPNDLDSYKCHRLLARRFLPFLDILFRQTSESQN